MPQQISLFDSLQNGEQTPSGGVHIRVPLRHTYQDIISIENLLLAWKEFVRGKRKKQDVQEFQYRLMDNILELHHDLKAKTYIHGGYHHFKISDPKPRDIHKASVRDRFLHHAIYRVLYPYFDTKFIYDSYSCRIRKGTHKAMNRFRDFAAKVSHNHTRTCLVLKCDIKKFFASIDQQVLMSILEKYISDQNILWLLNQVISSFGTIRSNGSIRIHHNIPTFSRILEYEQGETLLKKGLPLGNLTSQLLVNIYMNEFDQWVKHTLKAKHYIRYADDFVILSNDKCELEEMLKKIDMFLQEKLKLKLHPDKVYIKIFASGVDFLGWVHFPDHRILRTTTQKRMFRRLKEGKGMAGEEATQESYLGMLGHGNTKKLQARVL